MTMILILKVLLYIVKYFPKVDGRGNQEQADLVEQLEDALRIGE